MEHAQTTEKRLTDLEIKASFTEDLLDQLNQVIIRQQQDIDLLVREIRQVREQMPHGNANAYGRAADELPPHY